MAENSSAKPGGMPGRPIGTVRVNIAHPDHKTLIQQRPAVQRAYELAKTIITKPTVNQESESILFGQGRRSA